MTPGTKLEGRAQQALRAPRQPARSAVPATRTSVLSDLDGPLTHLLAKQVEAQRELAAAMQNVEQFMLACDIIIAGANGHPVSPELIPEPVAHWVNTIHRRAAEKSGRILHAAE